MNIGIFALACVPFHAKTLEERPLGGTETGVIHLANSLQKAGHQVVVITNHEDPPPSEPLYLKPSAISHLGELDVLIAVRNWLSAVSYPKAKLKCLWTGDSYDQPATYGIGDHRVIKGLDQLLLVSEWHKQTLCNSSGFPAEKALAMGNGIELDRFKLKVDKKPKRLIYSSTPFRGLSLLPDIFPRILEKHPDAELQVFSGEGLYPLAPSAVKEFHSVKEKLSKIKNCTVNEPITQTKLAIEMKKSAILAYPNTFAETSCITAIEAMAAGCIPVTSALGALPETIADAGIAIDGDPRSKDYQEKFISHVCKLFDEPKEFTRLSNLGIKRSEDYTWEKVALRLTDKLKSLLSVKNNLNQDKN